MPKTDNKLFSQKAILDAFHSLARVGEEILLPRSVTEDVLRRNPDRRPDEITSYLHRFDFGDFFLSLVYTPQRSDLTSAPSTLEARISLNKSETLFFFMPYDIIPFINPQDMICRYFPYIESPERLASCYRDLAESLIPYLSDFDRIANDDTLRQRAYQGIRDEMARCYGEPIDTPSGKGEDYDQALLALRFHHFIKWKSSFYSSAEYGEYLKGDPSYLSTIAFRGARPDYIKHIALSSMGKQRLEFLPVRPESASLSAMTEATKNTRTPVILALSMLLVFPIVFFVLGGLYYGVASLLGMNSLYYSALSVKAFLSNLLWIGVATFLLGKSLYPIVLRLFFKSRYARFAPYHQMAKAERHGSSLGKTTYLMLIAALLFTVLSACRGVNITEDALISRSGMLPISNDTYRYEDIASVEEIKQKDGSFFYLVTFEDGTKWNFKGLMDENGYRELADILEPLFEKHGVTVTKDGTDGEKTPSDNQHDNTNQA